MVRTGFSLSLPADLQTTAVWVYRSATTTATIPRNTAALVYTNTEYYRQICGFTAPLSMQTMVDTTFHIAVAELAAMWDVLLCYRTTPDTYSRAGFAYNLIKKSLTCTFWQVQMEPRMSVARVTECSSDCPITAAMKTFRKANKWN